MNDPDTLPAGVHEEVSLLPWYVNGTLSPSERSQLDRHLDSCPACRQELDELTRVKSNLVSAYRSASAPSSRLAQSVLSAVARESRDRRSAQSPSGSWLAGMDQWFRSLFLHRWVPTAVVLALVMQLGLLLWVIAPQPASDGIATRSLPGPSAKISVMLQPTATEKQIRTVLQHIHGQVVSGPTPDGRYIIMVVGVVDDAAVQQKLAQLLERTEVIRSAEIVTP